MTRENDPARPGRALGYVFAAAIVGATAGILKAIPGLPDAADALGLILASFWWPGSGKAARASPRRSWPRSR